MPSVWAVIVRLFQRVSHGLIHDQLCIARMPRTVDVRHTRPRNERSIAVWTAGADGHTQRPHSISWPPSLNPAIVVTVSSLPSVVRSSSVVTVCPLVSSVQNSVGSPGSWSANCPTDPTGHWHLGQAPEARHRPPGGDQWGQWGYTSMYTPRWPVSDGISSAYGSIGSSDTIGQDSMGSDPSAPASRTPLNRPDLPFQTTSPSARS